MSDASAITTFLFTDIEGSTRLWEREPSRMHDALARHDALAAATVAARRGRIVKSTGDGIHAVFDDPLDALQAAIAFLLALADPAATAGVALAVRCGLHAGVDGRRDNDFYGHAVNRAARVMSAAHGGQILLSEAVAMLVRGRLPSGVELIALGAVRLRDLAQPENLFQAAHASLRRDFPALRSLEATPNNLPQQLTSFIGREHELAEVRRMLKDTRLLTIFGIGGLGKSRLSVHVATDALDDYPDGVWFVELAPIADPRLVPQALASVLGVKEEAGEAVADTVARFARDRRMLLVLDNCEHLTQACAELGRKILEAARNVAILVTSRERLGIAGEKTYPLAPFPVPLPRQQLAPDAILSFASVRLFAERAAAARPDFAITQGNALAVAEICHRLDGIPLALELAAARVRAMPVQKIAERLIDRFKLLSGGDRTALPRQQTLRALIDWSYELLAPAERALFARLAIFIGGFTLEAAEKVVADDEIAEGDVLDLLTQLVEKSLVTLDLERDRYSMLETIRQYAEEKLDESGEKPAMRTRHLAVVLAWVEDAAGALLGPQQGEWLRKVDLDLENILAAHACCLDTVDGGALGLRLANAVKHYWLSRGLLDLGLRTTLGALAHDGARQRDVNRARGLFNAGQIAVAMGRYAEAQAYLEECLSIAREIGQRARIGNVLQPLGQVAMGRGDLAGARAYLTEAVAIANEVGDKRSHCAALNELAQLHRLEGDLDAATALYDQVVPMARELGDRESTAAGLLNCAMVAIARGDSVTAARLLDEVLPIIDETRSRSAAQSALDAFAALAALHGDWDAACRFHGAAESLLHGSGARRFPADEAFVLERTKAMRSQIGDAFAELAQSGGELDAVQALAAVRAWSRQRKAATGAVPTP